MARNRAVKSFVFFRGFSIPRKGVTETRDYLKRTLGWLELCVKLIHCWNFFCLGLLAIIAAWAMLSLLWSLQNGEAWQILLVRLSNVVGFGGILLVAFISTMIAEASMRVFPACIRYWVETQEEIRQLRARAATARTVRPAK